MGRALIFCLISTFGCSRSSGSVPGSSAKPAAAASEADPQAQAVKPGAPADSGASTTDAKKWDFEHDALDAAPSGIAFGRTGRGREGRWVVRTDGATKVLAQIDTDDANFRFPVAVANEPVLRDVRVSVRCKMVSGRVDQACGLVARYTDAGNYFVTRANALENNIRLYTVRDGDRDELASFDGTVTPNTWHEYRFELRGERLEVFWNGKRVIEHQDSSFSRAGQAGVWTKADSLTYFDDFTVEKL